MEREEFRAPSSGGAPSNRPRKRQCAGLVQLTLGPAYLRHTVSIADKTVQLAR